MEVKVIGFEDRLFFICKGNIKILYLDGWKFFIVGGGS